MLHYTTYPGMYGHAVCVKKHMNNWYLIDSEIHTGPVNLDTAPAGQDWAALYGHIYILAKTTPRDFHPHYFHPEHPHWQTTIEVDMAEEAETQTTATKRVSPPPQQGNKKKSNLTKSQRLQGNPPSPPRESPPPPTRQREKRHMQPHHHT